jgi:hypothetical protein
MAGPQLAQDEAGNIWDVSGAQPRLVKPAQASGPNVVVPAAPAKPEFVPGNPNLVYTPGQGVSALPGVPGPAAPAPNFVPGKPGFVVGGSPNAPQAVPIAGLPADGPQLDASVRQKAIQQYGYAQQLDAVADHLNELFIKGPGSTSGIEGLKDFLPSPTNKNFDAEANKSRGIIGQSLGFTGGQLNTEREAEKAVGPYIPESSNFDSTIEQKIQSMRDLAQNARETAIQTLGGVPMPNGAVRPATPQDFITPSAALPPVTMPSSGDQVDFATGKTRDVIDPVLKATGGKVGKMIADGTPDAQIMSFLKQSGVDPANTNVGELLQYRAGKKSFPGVPSFKEWQRANPGQAYPIGPAFYTKSVPMTPDRQILNKAAASNLGGAAIGAGVAATNAVTGGYLNDLTQDPAAAQTGMDLLRGRHPVASLVGDVAGQAALESMAGGVPGVGKLLAMRYGRPTADALYGAFSGSGESDDNRGVGAALGGVSGLGFGALGRGVQRAVGGLATGVTNPALQRLDNLGVPLTVGRIGRGSNSTIGHIVGGIEDRAAGLPGFDAVINTARKRGDVGFNQAAFKEAGGSGATGAAGLDELANLRTKAYDFLNPLQLPIDAQFAGSQAGVRAAIPDMPAFGSEVGKGLDQIDRVSANGLLNGRDFQSALSDTKANRSSIAGAPFSRNAVNALKDVEDNLQQLAARQGPQGTLDALNAANRLHAQTETLASALDNGPTQKGDQLFSAGRLDDASRVNTRKFGGRLASLTGVNRPFYDLTQAGNEVMPNLTPDSGTAGRMLLVPLASSAIGGTAGAALGDDRLKDGQFGAGYGALLGLAAMGPYSKTGQKIIQKALLADRPDRLVRIGNYIINANPKLAGMFGSSLGRDFFFQPELAQ